MSWNAEIDELNAKVQYLSKNLNCGKSPEQLEAGFKKWYTQEKLAQEEKKLVEDLTQDINDENLKYRVSYRSKNSVTNEIVGRLEVNRLCTLQAFTNLILLDSYKNNWCGVITFNSAKTNAKCEFNKGRAEYSFYWHNCRNALIFHNIEYSGFDNCYEIKLHDVSMDDIKRYQPLSPRLFDCKGTL